METERIIDFSWSNGYVGAASLSLHIILKYTPPWTEQKEPKQLSLLESKWTV